MISTPASLAASATVRSGFTTNCWFSNVTSDMYFFIRPTIIFSITASGLPLSRAISIWTFFSFSTTAGSRSASERDAGLTAAMCIATCLPNASLSPLSATKTPIFPMPSATALWTYVATCAPSRTPMRRTDMFSPIVAIASFTVVSTVFPSISAAFSASTSDTPKAAVAMLPTIAWKSAFLPTKSVSEFTSTAIPLPALTATATRPSAAVRPDFFAAFARPLVRSQSIAASMSPSVSVSAFLASIMPAPDVSRSCLTS